LEASKKRGVLVAMLFLQIFVLFLTFSRAALFGWVLASVIFLWMSRRLYRTYGLILVLSCSTILSGLILHEQLLNRGGIINYNEFARRSDQPRLTYQNMAIQMSKKHPYLGVGWNQYPVFTEKFVPEGSSQEFHMQTVHSIYFLLLAETGILGLGCFLIFALLPIWRNFRRGITTETALLLAIWLFLLAIGFCDHYLLTGMQGRLLLFIPAALLGMACQKTPYSACTDTKP
jgi:O-antigen ligase